MAQNNIWKFVLVVIGIIVVCKYFDRRVAQDVVTITPEQESRAKTTFQTGMNSKTSMTVTESTPTSTEVTLTPNSEQGASSSTTAPTAPTVSISQPVSATTPVTVSVTTQQAPQPAPISTPTESSTGSIPITQNGFEAMPLDLDDLFGRRETLSPSDLLPKNDDADLFADVKADPEFDKSFLQNRWLYGIDVSTSKRHYSNDLRGAPPPVPIVNVSPFNQPTQFPDQYSRSIKDVC